MFDAARMASTHAPIRKTLQSMHAALEWVTAVCVFAAMRFCIRIQFFRIGE